MPYCRECHSRISKFDKDRCPICGCINPLEGVTSETIEITNSLDTSSADFNKYTPQNKSLFIVLEMFLGFLGASFFYIKRYKIAFIMLFSSIFIVGGIGSLLAFLSSLGIMWGYLIPLVTIYGLHFLTGIILIFSPSLKDSHGEFLK